MNDKNLCTAHYGDRVGQILQRVTGQTVADDVNLFESGILDSLKLINLILELEEGFGVSIAENDLNFDNFRSRNAICEALAELVPSPVA